MPRPQRRPVAQQCLGVDRLHRVVERQHVPLGAGARVGHGPRADDHLHERRNVAAHLGDHAPILPQNDRGSPSTFSATYARIRLVDTGATW